MASIRIGLYLFILVHITLWTLAPTLIRHNLPMDAIEGITWGQAVLSWGYDKNPLLNAWVSRLALTIYHADISIYLASQLAVGICFLSIFKLGTKILPPIFALIAVLFLEGMQYYNLHAIDLSDNTLELATWSLTTLFFFKAITDDHLRDWLLTGCFASLALMTKYYSALLLLSMFLFMLTQAETRIYFFSIKIYLSILLCLLLLTPHFIWLYQHEFITLHYAVQRVSAPPTIFNHIFYPIQFVWQQFEVIIPSLILLLFLLFGKQTITNRFYVKPFNLKFLIWVGFGPLLLTMFLSFIFGMKLRAGWGMPLFSLYGILILALLRPNITPQKLKRFVGAVSCFLFLTIIGYSAALIRAQEESSANYPGRKIAKTIHDVWHQHHSSPLQFIAGNRWLAGNIAHYSQEKPAVYIDFDSKISPWINENTLKKQGAVFVWEVSEKERNSYEEINKRFPLLNKPQLFEFSWQRNSALPKIKIIIALIDPISE